MELPIFLYVRVLLGIASVEVSFSLLQSVAVLAVRAHHYSFSCGNSFRSNEPFDLHFVLFTQALRGPE